MSIVTLTESAIKQMDSMLLEHSKPAIRLELQGGGCSGFKYNWTLEDNLELQSEPHWIHTLNRFVRIHQ